MSGGLDGPPGRVGAGVRGEEEVGHGFGGEDEGGGGGLPHRPHQGQGALEHHQGPGPVDGSRSSQCAQNVIVGLTTHFEHSL